MEENQTTGESKLPVLHPLLLRGLREAVERGLTGKQILAIIKIFDGLTKTSSEVNAKDVFIRCKNLLTVIEDDVRLELLKYPNGKETKRRRRK